MLVRREKQCPAGKHITSFEADGLQAAMRLNKRFDRFFLERDSAPSQTIHLLACEGLTVCAKHKVVGPLPQQHGEICTLVSSTIHRDGRIAVLPAIAIRADVDAFPNNALIPGMAGNSSTTPVATMMDLARTEAPVLNATAKQ